MKIKVFLVLSFSFLFLFPSCSLVRNVAVDTTSDLFKEASLEMESEPNWISFEQGTIANIKMLEGLHFVRPFNQKLIAKVNYSPDPENPHKGVVFSPLEIGSVLASMEGRIVAIDFMDGYHNYVIIEHPNGYFSVYGNLDEVFVAEGQIIKKGEILGNLMKEKGLYFQVNQGKKTLDPISLIKS